MVTQEAISYVYEDPLVEALSRRGTTSEYKSNGVVFRKDSEAHTLFVVKKGIIITRTPPEQHGSTLLMPSIWREGDIFGFEALGGEGETYTTNAVAGIDSVVTAVDKQDVTDLVTEDPSLYLELGGRLAREVQAQENYKARIARTRQVTPGIATVSALELMHNGQVVVNRTDQAARLGIMRQTFVKLLRENPQVPRRP